MAFDRPQEAAGRGPLPLRGSASSSTAGTPPRSARATSRPLRRSPSARPASQDGADSSYRRGAVAPISGAYAFRDAEIPALLAGRGINPKTAVAYTTYLLVAWNRHDYEGSRHLGTAVRGTAAIVDWFAHLPACPMRA
ncbi:hypothetical protein Airi01_029430 [Actinoallomurus iriomotensis]|uniref:Uncharacterized protein n=1 Tax=Actinoallomurus iriomotensis TaxID=478107 RepID=A0A9W6VQJ2_9ACTN|nr:hypothetical protein Airi01_029430 [Actinoallomurus iriomotensis]